jgi:hypothetical protein
MRDTKDLQETAAPQPVRKGHIGLIVAGSVLTGLIAALGLAVVVFGGAAEPVITGAVLWGFALGWAMLAVLSVRFTDQPQRWAVVPAVFMGVSGPLPRWAGATRPCANTWMQAHTRCRAS